MKSKVNLELKYFCIDFKPIRVVLKKLGAHKVIVKTQKDYFFNLPENKNSKIPIRLKLRNESKAQTLVYYTRPKFSVASGVPADVTIFPVKDKNLFSFISKTLGIRAIVIKKRELWKKDNTVFHLDNVKGVGQIFEMETWTSPKTIKQDRNKFNLYRKKFLPYLDSIIKGSNEDLVNE